MKFSTQEDLETPIQQVFDRLCDFAYFERAAMRRGAEVARLGDWTKTETGNIWTASFSLRGKRRRIELEIACFDPPDELQLDLRAKSLAGTIGFELVALSRTRTRLIVGFEIRPLTLPARLLVQSMKLSKPSLTRKFKHRVAEQIVLMQQNADGDG
jgi:hypothetical protein